jgi:DNA modification methylase
MAQLFKTISFPREYSETQKTEILRLAFNEDTDLELYNHIKNLKSSDIRTLLPNISYKKLIEQSTIERRSLNQFCIFLLSKKIEEIKKSYGKEISIPSILSKNLIHANINKNSATFHDNKINQIHRWYPYIEGFSCTFVEEIINNLPYKPSFIYDPFSGTGTTQLVASHKNIPSAYSEINPFMNFIIEFKINKVIDFISNYKNNVRLLENFINALPIKIKTSEINKELYNLYIKKLGTEDYFENKTLEILLKISLNINEFFKEYPLLKDTCFFALSAIIVYVSNTIRRADLRYKTENEKKVKSDEVLSLFINKIKEMLLDMASIKNYSLHKTKFISNDAKTFLQPPPKKFDLVITSPPYVNGTNYFRNTKLELVLLNFISDIKELSQLKKDAITSGINNVVGKNRNNIKLPEVEPIVRKLSECAYDKRIPLLVESYFSDMFRVFGNISANLENESYFYLDIGDSQFAGVHIPADKILIEIAKKNNFELIDNKFIRERFSKDGSLLKQVLLLFKKHSKKVSLQINCNSFKSPHELLIKNYSLFRDTFPYKKPPYNSRNWGHALHNLCSYQGKLKPSIAHFLVKLFSNEGMKILDPLCGVGTIPLEASLQGRIGIGNDLSLLAYANTLTKVSNLDRNRVRYELDRLSQYIKRNLVSEKVSKNIDFGFNRNITEYYHPETFREIVTARNYFKAIKSLEPEKALLLSAVLHILHGNRPYALSRRSHNVTPLAPKGPYVYKSLIEKTNEKIRRTLEVSYPDHFKAGKAFNKNYIELDKYLKDGSVDLIVTSPPFFDSTRFYMNNWIRMWFCGWDKGDFKTQKYDYLETQQIKDMGVYRIFIQKCKKLLTKEGVLIMHLGKSGKQDMGKTLSEIASDEFEIFGMFDEMVSHCEKFGIKDQGATKAHQFLFLIK